MGRASQDCASFLAAPALCSNTTGFAMAARPSATTRWILEALPAHGRYMLRAQASLSPAQHGC